MKIFSKDGLRENKYILLGHLTFLFLFVFSCIFVHERILLIDSCAQVFEFIRDEGFQIYANRYSMYLFQLLPVFMVKIHAPLSAVLYSYSLSFLIIAYIFWLITVYFLKNKPIGILMLFIMIGIRQTFFHAISETFQLMFFACFLYAWLFQTRDYLASVFSKTIYYSVALLFIVLCIFIHPVAVFFVIFICGLYVLDKHKALIPKIVISILSIGLILGKMFLVKEANHDATFTVSTKEFFERLFSVFSLNSTKWYLERILDFYWVPFLIFVMTLVFCWKKKRFWHLAFYLCFIIGFWLVTVITYSTGGGDIAMERSFLPLFFFCGLPFMTEIFPSLSTKWDKVFFTLLTVLIIGGFVKIAVAARPYTKRLNKIEEIATLANQQGKKKLLIEQKTINEIFPVNSWGLGFESIVYSALKGKDSTVSMFAVEKFNPDEKRYKDPNLYLAVPWWPWWKIDELNPHYFKLPEQAYSLLVLENGTLLIKEIE